MILARFPGEILNRTVKLLPLVLLAGVITGCASHCTQRFDRPFDFAKDTFAYRNDLVWEYVFDDTTGQTSHRTREPKPGYTHHCFVVARSARQFFQHARFDPALPGTSDEEYRKRIREVASRDPSECMEAQDKVIIPGFANLREFSEAKPRLLQEECGGAWRSYFQRGHWRMLFGFSRARQKAEVTRLIESIRQNRPPVVHIVKFPKLTINHALLLFAVTEDVTTVQFTVYDPYNPMEPEVLTFDRATGTFTFPRNPYFIGGEVDIYEIYRAWNY